MFIFKMKRPKIIPVVAPRITRTYGAIVVRYIFYQLSIVMNFIYILKHASFLKEKVRAILLSAERLVFIV